MSIETALFHIWPVIKDAKEIDEDLIHCIYCGASYIKVIREGVGCDGYDSDSKSGINQTGSS